MPVYKKGTDEEREIERDSERKSLAILIGWFDHPFSLDLRLSLKIVNSYQKIFVYIFFGCVFPLFVCDCCFVLILKCACLKVRVCTCVCVCKSHCMCVCMCVC